MVGKALYSQTDMNQQFKEAFNKEGFNELRDTYTITIPNSGVQIKGAFKQIDFVKGKVLVEVQFGKYAFIFFFIILLISYVSIKKYFVYLSYPNTTK